MIVTGSNPDRARERFESVIEAGVAESPWAQESSISILVCRGLRQPVDPMWREIRFFI